MAKVVDKDISGVVWTLPDLLVCCHGHKVAEYEGVDEEPCNVVVQQVLDSFFWGQILSRNIEFAYWVGILSLKLLANWHCALDEQTVCMG